MSWCLNFCAVGALCMLSYFMLSGHLLGAHSAYDMFSWYEYLIVNLVFSLLGFWSGNLFSDCAFSRSLPTCTFSNKISDS